MTRSELLALDDDALSRLCRCDRFRASGPGGQHRNTSDTAVRLTLADSGLTASASESRSQHQNRRQAVRRLRLVIAMEMRDDAEPVWDQPWKIGAKDRRYPAFLAILLDAMHQHDYAVRDAAGVLGLSTGKLIRLLADNPQLWARVNQERQRRQLHPLQMP